MSPAVITENEWTLKPKSKLQEVKHLETGRQRKGKSKGRRNSARHPIALGQFYIISIFCFLKGFLSLWPPPQYVCKRERDSERERKRERDIYIERREEREREKKTEAIVMLFPHKLQPRPQPTAHMSACRKSYSLGGLLIYHWFPLRNKSFIMTFPFPQLLN